MLFYDCEAAKCIGEMDRYSFCEGWDDFNNMGISVIGTYTNAYGYRAFTKDELLDFQDLLFTHKEIIGFNSKKLDDKLIKANGLDIGYNL